MVVVGVLGWLVDLAGGFALVTATLWFLGCPWAPPSHVSWICRQRQRAISARRRAWARLSRRGRRKV